MENKVKKLLIWASFAMLLGLAGCYLTFPEATSDLLMAVERRAAGLKQHSKDVEGWRIEYLEGGKGDTLVLLHGFGADKDNWTRLGRYLTPHFRLIAPDLPGFGESSADPEADYTIGAQVERLKAFLGALGITSFHLGGSSMGGNIAGAYASRYPEEVKSLLLIAPGGVASSQPSEMYRLLTEGKPNPLVVKNAEGFEDLLDFVFVKRPFMPLSVKKHLMQRAIEHQSLNSTIFEQLVDSRHVSSLEALLDGLPVPTLIVWGRQDRVLHVSGARILSALLPRATVVVMDSVGHLPMLEKPRETAEAYLGFIDQTEPGFKLPD